MEPSEELFSELLTQLRKRSGLTQQQLANQIGASRSSVSLWERGNYKPETDTTLYEIARVLGLSEQEKQRLFQAYTVTALQSSFHNPPLTRNPYFTGREDLLLLLHQQLSAGKQVALTQAISGLGGIGKTQTILEYAYRYQRSYHDIFWANAYSQETLVSSYTQLAVLLQLKEQEDQDQNQIVEAVKSWLREHRGWLLVLDNIEDLSLVEQFVPVNRQGSVVLTTRRSVTAPVAQTLELDVFPEKEGTLFLLKRSGYLRMDNSLDCAKPFDVASASAITRILGGLPLALDQAGAYILETGCRLLDYLQLFQQKQTELLQRRAGVSSDHPDSVTTTFTLAFEQVEQRNKIGIEMLKVCTFLAPDTIAEEIITEGGTHLGAVIARAAHDDMAINAALEALRSFSVLRRNREARTLSIHRLVQAVLQSTLGEQERAQWRERIITALDALFPQGTHEFWQQCERLVPHVLISTTDFPPQMQSRELASLLIKTANYLRERAQYAQAEALCQRALQIREQVFGPEHLEVTTPLNNLAILYYRQGKYAQAEALYQRALQITEQELGSEHLEMASPLHNLAIVYHEQGKYSQAEPLYQRTLRIREQELGSEHLEMASPLHSLANLYCDQGKYSQAEIFYQRALHIMEQARGVEHPLCAYPIEGLAIVYYEQGKYSQAEPLYQRALHIMEQAWGTEHPEIARILTNLATLYCGQGEYERAEAFFLRAVQVLEQALGPEHPQTANTLSGLANLYRDQGKCEQADPLYQRALTLQQQQLGSQHPDTAQTLHDFAVFQETQGENQKAASLYQRALAIREHIFGLQHPKTIATQRAYTALLGTLDQ